MNATDTLLVDQSKSGDRDAFAEIVRRYQSLICSIAFSSTGNLNASEELAQEAFVSAWTSLGTLNDPSKLRPWLCGIVRNLANSQSRKRNRDVLSNAAEIEHAQCADVDGNDPVKTTIAREEAELLNRTLTAMPEQYREPMVLFYREQQSVSRVAELLELSPSAVKQRLARGRELLRSEVAAVIERGLLQSAPSRAFTIGVLAALPIMSGSAKAATATITTAKGVSAMNAAGLAGMAGVILGPLAGLLGGWFGYSMSMKSARSERERRFIRRTTASLLCLILVFGVGMTLMLVFGKAWLAENPMGVGMGIAALGIGYTVALFGGIIWTNRRIARIRQEDGTVDMPPAEVAAKMPSMVKQFQFPRYYDSKMKLCGLPLVSVRFSGASSIGRKDVKPAVGWIAIGDWAYGVLFACGSVAVGGIAFGAIGVGLISVGGLAIGGLAFGGGAIGWGASGGIAIGWIGFGGMALAWKAAVGGMAVSHEFALGGLVVGEHSNNDVAKAFVENSKFFRYSGMLMSPWGWWVLIAIMMTPMLIAIKLIPSTQDEKPSNRTS